jgi:cyclopropane-fatty-acyl-phospholipid synthase
LLPDGREVRHANTGDPAVTLSFRTPRAYWRTALYGHVGLLEAYFDGDSTSRAACQQALAAGMEGGARRARLLVRWLNRVHEFLHSNVELAQRETQRRVPLRARAGVLPLWLDDPLMLYTCAYWADGDCARSRRRSAPSSTTSRARCCSAGRGGGRRRQRLRRLPAARRRSASA